MPRIFKTTTTSKKLSRVSPFARLRDVADDVELLSTALDIAINPPTTDVYFASLARALDGIISGTITRDSNGAAISASVVWPNGETGSYTALTVSTTFPGAIDSYKVTRGLVTYTHPAVTRDSNGAVTNRPNIVVS